MILILSEVDEETANMPTREPKPGSGKFHITLELTLSMLKGTENLDEVIVTGKTRAEHKSSPEKVLDRLKDSRFKFEVQNNKSNEVFYYYDEFLFQICPEAFNNYKTHL